MRMKLCVYKGKINYYAGLPDRWEDKYKNEAHPRHLVGLNMARECSNAFILKEKIKSHSEEVASKKGPKDSKLHEFKLQCDLNVATFSIYDKNFEIMTLKNKLAEMEGKNSQLENNLSKVISDNYKLKNPYE